MSSQRAHFLSAKTRSSETANQARQDQKCHDERRKDRLLARQPAKPRRPSGDEKQCDRHGEQDKTGSHLVNSGRDRVHAKARCNEQGDHRHTDDRRDRSRLSARQTRDDPGEQPHQRHENEAAKAQGIMKVAGHSENPPPQLALRGGHDRCKGGRIGGIEIRPDRRADVQQVKKEEMQHHDRDGHRDPTE